VRNLDEFHEVYDTTEGDGLWLDPAERVRIW
jgi:endothelin-converting enzyme/putative endopeptidase